MYKNPVQFAPGNYYHIYNRSNNGELIFPNKSWRRTFKRIMKKHLKPFIHIRCYAVLDNHFHLLMKQKTLTPYVLGKVKTINRKAAQRLLEDPTDPELYSLFISDLYKAAFQEFSTLYNQKMKRKGHVIQQRFKRKQIDMLNVPYLIAYIHNNPRHHGLVNDVDLWEASSHNDKAFQAWIREFGKKSFKELSAGDRLYYRLLDVVNKIKTGEIGKVPKEIWAELHQLLGIKKQAIRSQTKHLINFDRSLG